MNASSGAVEGAYIPQLRGNVAAKDISVVIQGPLKRQSEKIFHIDHCIASIRQYLPEAEIIISTWEGEDTSGLEAADKVLLSPDPGGWRDCNGVMVNLERQRVSTLVGIRAAGRPWVLKMRADSALSGTDFLKEYTYGKAVPEEQKMLSCPIITLTHFTRDPAKVPYLFHVSDLLLFGKREDLLDFWTEEAFPEEHNQYPRHPFGRWGGYTLRSAFPEQALTLRWLNRHGIPVTLKDPDTISFSLAQLSEQILCSHFHMMSPTEAAVLLPGHLLYVRHSTRALYQGSQLPAIANKAFGCYKMRYAQIWINKNLLFWCSFYWWVQNGHMLLRRSSPTLANLLRAVYRKLCGYQKN